MRIVFLSPTLGDAYGQERILAREVRFLKQSGHCVYLIGDQIRGVPPLCDEVFTVAGISRLNSLSSPKQFLEIKNKLLKILEKIKPDIVHLIDQFDSRIMKAVANGYPSVLTAHTVAPTCPSSQRFFPKMGGVCSKQSGWGCFRQSQKTGCLGHFKSPFHRLHALFEYKQKRQALRLFSGIGAISPYVERTLIEDGFQRTQVFPVYNFIENSEELASQEKRFPPLLLVVSRLVPLKGIEVFLKNLQLIKHLNWQCWIFGDGPVEQDLKHLTHTLQLDDRVLWKGKRPTQEIKEALKEAAVFIQPNRGPEGFGLAVAEAIGHKIPVLAYDVPALNDLIQSGKNGVLVPLQLELGLASELDKMLQDSNYLKALSSTDSHLFQTYSAESHFENLLKFYARAQERFKERS